MLSNRKIIHLPNRHEVYIQILNINWYLTHSLSSISVQEYLAGSTYFSYFPVMKDNTFITITVLQTMRKDMLNRKINTVLTYLMGCITPISLLTIMTDTRAVSGRIAASRSATDTMPDFFTGKYVTSQPSFSRARHESKTHLCSWNRKCSVRFPTEDIHHYSNNVFQIIYLIIRLKIHRANYSLTYNTDFIHLLCNTHCLSCYHMTLF